MDGSWIAIGLIAVITILTVSRMFRKKPRQRQRSGAVQIKRIRPRHGDGGGAGGDNDGGL